ncbi:MAG: helix-turn-helix transcriptional regulator [Firmicutes bacterium]|nr:helix-turn-helix transcriptional regulator [Bacillota bacterium]
MSELLPGIRQRRKAAGMTIEELAAAVGCSRQAAGFWETGQTLPTADRLPEIARALGCSIDDLFTEIINQEENESHDLQ